MPKLKLFKIITVTSIVIGLTTVGILTYNYFNSNNNSNSSEMDSEGKTGPKLGVVVSFYPLYEFSKNVGKGEIDLVNLTPTGTDAHSFEPTATAIKIALESDIFIFQGGSLEGWAKSIKSQKTSGKTIEMMEYFANEVLDSDKHHKDDDDNKAHEDYDEDEHHDEESHHHHNDSHLWLDPVLAKRQVEIIRDVFSQAKPESKEIFQKNAKQYISKLENLHSNYQQRLSNCSKNIIITSHDAFQYLGRRYNLVVEPVSYGGPNDEPSAGRIKELLDLIKREEIEYIFVEKNFMESPPPSAVMPLFNSEVYINTFFLDSVEYLTLNQQKEGDTYLSIMEANLESLVEALECN